MFLGKRWFWTGQAGVFHSEKDGLALNDQLFPSQKMVLARKSIFFLGDTKKTIFLVSGHVEPHTDGSFGFP